MTIIIYGNHNVNNIMINILYANNNTVYRSGQAYMQAEIQTGMQPIIIMIMIIIIYYILYNNNNNTI